MFRLFAVLTSFALAGFSAAEEPAKVPAKPEEKKAAPAKTQAKSEEKEELDVHKTAERIAENAEKAGARLKVKDPGADTRKIQREILKDIDALLKKAQEPPPPPKSSDMPPPMMPPPKDGMPPPKSPMPMGMGGTGNMPPPKGGGSGTQGGGEKKPRRERKSRGGSPMGKDEPMGNAGAKGTNSMPAEKKEGKEEPKGGKEGKGDRFGKASPKRENDKLAELYKDVWGHLPERLRQEMDLYYREQFMPRYSELLRQYYSSLAEQRKKSGEGR